MEPLIRLARTDDAEGIARVHIRSWQHAYRGIMPATLLGSLSLAKWTEDWQERLTNTTRITLVLEVGGEIQGWAAVGPSSPQEGDREAGEVYGIYLAPEWWAQTLGARLLAVAERRLQDAGYWRIALWVVDANQRARRFYEKSGYVCDGSDREIERGGLPLNQLRYTKQLSSPTVPG